MLHVSLLEPKFSKVLTFTISRQKCCKGIFFYIVILKIYQTAIQYLVNATLSLVVTPRHDKKLAMPISSYMQKYSTSQHQQRFIEIEYICPFNSSKLYYVILSLYTIVSNNSVHGRPTLRTTTTIEGISSYIFLTASL